MNTRIMPTAIALAAVSLLGAQTSHAQTDTVTLVRVVPVAHPGLVGTDVTIMVLGIPNDQTTTFPFSCGTLGSPPGPVYEDIEVLVLSGLPGQPELTTAHHGADVELTPGTRVGDWSIDSLQCCIDANHAKVACADPSADREVRELTGDLVQAASAGAALFTSPVALDVDALGVVTGQPDDDGTHTVIFKTQGSPAQQVDIASYDELLPADVLRDLIDFGENPGTVSTCIWRSLNGDGRTS